MLDEVPYINFAPLKNALIRLENSANSYAAAVKTSDKLSAAGLKKLNEILYKAERSLLSTDGLPMRPWYKHQIYAPGYYTGYGVKTMPLIRESIEQRKWKDAEEGVKITAKALDNFTNQIDLALEVLKK